jgi:hypothetical protein
MPVTKTLSTPLALQQLAAGALLKSAVIDVSTAYSIDVFWSFSPDSGAVTPDAATQLMVEGSEDASGDGGWFTVSFLGSRMSLATADTLDSGLSAGATVMPEASASASITPINSYIFLKNATIGNSEWKQISKVNAATSLEFFDGVVNAQAGGETWYNQAERFTVSFNIEALTRIRAVVNNNAGGTNRNVIVECKVIVAT